MSTNTQIRQELLPALAAHVLANGLGNASLRPLARAAGTSDRMLIYHFGNKDGLIAELLAYIAEQFTHTLDQIFGTNPPTTRRECVERILEQTSLEAMKPFMALWWEIVAGAARGSEAYVKTARQVMQQLLTWLEGHMPEDDPDPAGGARFMLTFIEGAQMLGAIGSEEIAEGGLAAAKL